MHPCAGHYFDKCGNLCTYLYQEETVLLLLYLRQVEKGFKKKFVTKKKKFTAKGCPASTFLQRWAIFTCDFLGIDILLNKYKTSKITSTSTTIDCMVIFVTFVDVVIPLLLHHFVKWDRPWLCILWASCFCFFFSFLFVWEVNPLYGLNLWLCVGVLVYMFPCSCVSVINQRSDVSYCGSMNHFKCSLWKT